MPVLRRSKRGHDPPHAAEEDRRRHKLRRYSRDDPAEELPTDVHVDPTLEDEMDEAQQGEEQRQPVGNPGEAGGSRKLRRYSRDYGDSQGQGYLQGQSSEQAAHAAAGPRGVGNQSNAASNPQHGGSHLQASKRQPLRDVKPLVNGQKRVNSRRDQGDCDDEQECTQSDEEDGPGPVTPAVPQEGVARRQSQAGRQAAPRPMPPPCVTHSTSKASLRTTTAHALSVSVAH